MANYKVTVSSQARTIFSEILTSTEERFGQNVRKDYRKLISQAFHDLADRPQDARSHDEIFFGCHLYHIKWSLKRARAAHHIHLRSARHFLVCKFVDKNTIHVLDIIYDGMDLPRQIIERLEISQDKESDDIEF